jgi:hypothetical protein
MAEFIHPHSYLYTSPVLFEPLPIPYAHPPELPGHTAYPILQSVFLRTVSLPPPSRTSFPDTLGELRVDFKRRLPLTLSFVSH